jgi:uncharacterized protein
MKMNKTAVITGASSGIGSEFAKKLAIKGYDLILTGRRENLLQKLCKELNNKYKIKSEYIITDFSDLNQIKTLAEKIKNIDNLEFLVNNAGFGTPDAFIESDIEKQIEMILVHDIATVRFTHAAIPIMLKHKKGYIINVSSVAAWLLNPGGSMYSATKILLNSFSESLALTLRNTGIRIQALCPGFTLTDFHEKLGIAKSHPMYKKFMSAEYVVNYSLKDLEKNKVISIPGFKYKFVKLVNFIPRKLLYNIILFYSKRMKEPV